MGKNVAVFVDVANIFYAAKAAGVDIDYVTLLKAASAGRDLVRAYAYTGLDPENENQRNFHSFLARNGYKVVSKDIRKYGDGKVKANLDIELVVDMLKTARNLDVARWPRPPRLVSPIADRHPRSRAAPSGRAPPDRLAGPPRRRYLAAAAERSSPRPHDGHPVRPGCRSGPPPGAERAA